MGAGAGQQLLLSSFAFGLHGRQLAWDSPTCICMPHMHLLFVQLLEVTSTGSLQASQRLTKRPLGPCILAHAFQPCCPCQGLGKPDTAPALTSAAPDHKMPLCWPAVLLSVVTRLIPKLKWTHVWWGRTYIISMLWATGGC